MNDTSASAAPVSWTWADLLSTYTFWALLILYVASMLCTGLFGILIVRFRLSSSDYGLIFAPRTYGVIPALWLGWIASRWKTKPMLLALALLQAIGFSLVVFPGPGTSFLVRGLGAFCWGVGYYSLLLVVAAVLAGGLGGTENFVVTFGTVFAVSALVQALSSSLVGNFVARSYGVGVLTYFAVGALLFGFVVLLAVRRNLFHDPPPARGYSFLPVRRSPVAAARLCMFVPFYVLYWLYKVHGEVASFAPSRALLSPRAAVGVSFVPFMGPLMLVTLAHEMNRFAASKGLPRIRSPWAVFFLTLFLTPVAIGLVQSALNDAAPPLLREMPVAS